MIGEILGKIFGDKKAVETGMAGIDKIFYTKEEKADDGIRRTSAKLMFLKTYEAFKVAQRFIALLLGIPFVLVHVLCALFWFVLVGFAVFSGVPIVPDEPGAYEFGVSQLLLIADMNNKTLGEPFAWAVIFYYGGGAGEGLISKFMTSRGTKK